MNPLAVKKIQKCPAYHNVCRDASTPILTRRNFLSQNLDPHGCKQLTPRNSKLG